MAIGSRRYIRLAKILGLSLERHSPDVPRAVITDSADPALHDLYHASIPYRPDWHDGGFLYKFYLQDYSPFQRTLYLDCDCLVVHDLSHIWRLFADVPFGVEGTQQSEGDFDGDIALMCRRLGVASIPRFNGGMYYFTQSDEAIAVFATARTLMSQYDELGLRLTARGSRSDEPVLAMALASHGIRAVDDHGSTMRTPIGIEGELKIDVLRGYCRFTKAGVVVTPAIVHFADWRTLAFHYNREALKLQIARSVAIQPERVSRGVDAICNPLYSFAQIGRPLLPVLRRGYRKWYYR